MYRSIKEDDNDCFDEHDLSSRNIQCRPLPLDAQPTPTPDTFFIPMTREELEQHPLDLEDEKTKEEFEERGWVWMDEDLPGWLTSLEGGSEAEILDTRLRDAEALCCLVNRFFTCMERRCSGNKQSKTLMEIAGWKPG
jgi:hypothetical protein